MKTTLVLLIALLGISLIVSWNKKNNLIKIIGVVFLVLLIFKINVSFYNTKLALTAPALTQVNEFISEKSIDVLSLKDTEEFTVILFEYGYYILSNNQNNTLMSDGVKTSGRDKQVYIDGADTQKTSFVTLIINDADILKKADQVELTFKDGTKVAEKISGKGTIVTYHKISNNEAMPYEKLTIYGNDMAELYEYPNPASQN